MNIKTKVFGVEQAVNFDTMTSQCFVVIEVLGETMRVPITEEQMGQMVAQAALEFAEKKADDEAEEIEGRMSEGTPVFDETHETTKGPLSEGTPPAEQRNFSMMAGVSDAPSPNADPDQAEADPAFGALAGFFETPEEEKAKAKQLRNQVPPIRTVPRDEAGNPVVAQPALPALPGIAPLRDDDFPQG